MSTWSPRLNVNGTPCNVFHGEDLAASLIERRTATGPESEVRLKCLWGDRFALYTALMGGVALDNDGEIVRVPPWQHPECDYLFVESIGDVKGLGAPKTLASGWIAYDYAILPVRFACPTFQYRDDVGRPDPSGLLYTTTRFRVSAESFQPPTGAYYIGPFNTPTAASGKLVPGSQIGIIRARVEISMIRHWMPEVRVTEAMELIGSVNDSPITIGDRDYPVGTLLFAGLANDPHNDPTGLTVQDIELTLLGNFTVEWNQYLAEDGSYQFLNTKKDGSGDDPFEEKDLSPLFA